jgi:hypothetical protein
VDTRGFNGKAWLDQLGRPSTDALHVTERFTATKTTGISSTCLESKETECVTLWCVCSWV